MKILNIGSLNLDHTYSPDHIVRPGETVTARALTTAAGGKGLNQSIAFARAGARIYHAGCYGAEGVPLVKLLSENGVNVSLLKKVNEPQGHAIIQVEESGNNSIIVYGGSNRCLTRLQTDDILAGFGTGDLLTLQNEVNELPYIAQAAHARGMTVVLNPSPFDKAIMEVDFNSLSWLVVNEVETQALTDTQDAEAAYTLLHKKYPGLKVIVTLGTRGAYCFDGENAVFQPAFRVRAVDTTGAGDTFTGYFFASLAAGKAIPECMLLAARAAAIGVTRPGAAPSVPYLNEVISAAF